MRKHIASSYRLLQSMLRHPVRFGQALNTVPAICNADNFSRAYTETPAYPRSVTPSRSSQNPLWNYFQNHREGHGIWKWEHYFDIYHRHFARFIGQPVNILEIGIYSGGSLEMWRSYFGEQSHIYGVDIEQACKEYEDEHVTVFIGDQGDRSFWRSFRKDVKNIDILIDDGGHTAEQQQITLEEMLPHLRPGGVYLCEDVHGRFNKFSAFAANLVHELNSEKFLPGHLLQSEVTSFQSSIYSIHFYPYVVVIEKLNTPPARFSAPRHGTEWQPFL